MTNVVLWSSFNLLAAKIAASKLKQLDSTRPVQGFETLSGWAQ
jgi:hypothetical protein